MHQRCLRRSLACGAACSHSTARDVRITDLHRQPPLARRGLAPGKAAVRNSIVRSSSSLVLSPSSRRQRGRGRTPVSPRLRSRGLTSTTSLLLVHLDRIGKPATEGYDRPLERRLVAVFDAIRRCRYLLQSPERIPPAKAAYLGMSPVLHPACGSLLSAKVRPRTCLAAAAVTLPMVAQTGRGRRSSRRRATIAMDLWHSRHRRR